MTCQVVNGFFILDLLFNFHTGYVDPATRMLVLDVRYTRLHYLRGWFGADLVATIPFDLMLDTDNVNGGLYLLVTLLRLLRMLRLLRLTRITTRLQIKSGLQTSTQVSAALSLYRGTRRSYVLHTHRDTNRDTHALQARATGTRRDTHATHTVTHATNTVKHTRSAPRTAPPCYRRVADRDQVCGDRGDIVALVLVRLVPPRPPPAPRGHHHLARGGWPDNGAERHRGGAVRGLAVLLARDDVDHRLRRHRAHLRG